MKNINFTDNADQADQQDLLIINQHGGSPDFVFDPVIQDEINSPGQSVRNFLEVERDTGAKEITDSVFRILSDSGLRVARIDVLPPRAVMDTNRRPHLASSVPFSGPAMAEIVRIHKSTTQEILDILSKTNPLLVLDQHTMAPSAPDKSPQLSLEEPRSFDSHIDVWNAASRTGVVRDACIITSTSDGKTIGNPLLSELLESKLRVMLWIRSKFNEPFAPNPERHQGQLFIGDGRGVALDIPKHLFTDTPRSGIDLSRLEISSRQVEDIACVIATAIKHTLDTLKR